MNIGGFQKTTLIDFPGNIACIVFTQGCNFFCRYCHNPRLVPLMDGKTRDKLLDEKEILDFLAKRNGLLEGVVISGGEPTLQKDLIPFIYSIKKMGYHLKLDSNGSHPEILAKLFESGLIDFISMDIKTNLDNYHLVSREKFEVEKIFESIRLLMEKAPGYEFRTTCARPFIDEKIIADIGEMVKGASRYVLQQCSRDVEVLNPKFLKEDSHFFSNREMLKLKAILDKYVVTSVVR